MCEDFPGQRSQLWKGNGLEKHAGECPVLVSAARLPPLTVSGPHRQFSVSNQQGILAASEIPPTGCWAKPIGDEKWKEVALSHECAHLQLSFCSYLCTNSFMARSSRVSQLRTNGIGGGAEMVIKRCFITTLICRSTDLVLHSRRSWNCILDKMILYAQQCCFVLFCLWLDAIVMAPCIVTVKLHYLIYFSTSFFD